MSKRKVIPVQEQKVTEIFIVDANTLMRVKPISMFSSFEWTQSYNRMGYFELHCDTEYFRDLYMGEGEDVFLQHSADLNRFGVVEYVEVIKDEDDTVHLMVRGRLGECLLDRKVAFGTTFYESIQPAQMIKNHLEKHVINPVDADRTVGNLIFGNFELADGGLDCFGATDSNVYADIENMARTAYLGFNLRIAENITTETDPEGGEDVLVWNPPRLIFDTYRGVNRTEADNTETEIVIVPVTNLLANGQFAGSGQEAAGWTGHGRVGTGRRSRWGNPRPPETPIPPPGLTVSGGTVTVTRNFDMFQMTSPGGGSGDWIRTWNASPHLTQTVNLVDKRLYFMAVEVDNRTGSNVAFGINGMMQTGMTAGFSRLSALFVPAQSGNHTFVAGLGELEEMTNQIVRFRSAVLIDMTSTFGVGREPDFNYMQNNVYFENGSWRFRKQIIHFIPNKLTPLVFSRDRSTLSEIEYSKSITNERNFAYIRGEGDIVTAIDRGEKGWRRKEVIINPTSEVPRRDGDTLFPLPSYRAALENNAEAVMRRLVVNEVAEGRLYLMSNKQFGRDFYLGDRVSVTASELGFAQNMRISEVSEVWDTEGYNISVKLGDDIPSFDETVRLVARGAR